MSRDPQLTVDGEYKVGERSDMIVFTIPIAFFELVCIAIVPPEGSDKTKVYVKFKMARPQRRHNQRPWNGAPYNENSNGNAVPEAPPSSHPAFVDADPEYHEDSEG